ncbi:MAG: Gfo/Idh/MocA family oxidoreductase [Planctomycetales bacterium]|nr:Gfo/Idh/MocA family oxidoreductase [Planctomycetales bacterium]
MTKEHSMTQRRPVQPDRRQFLGALGVAGAAGVFTFPQSAARAQSPNERVRVAAIGTTNRAGANIRDAAGAGAEIVALADVDESFLGKAKETYTDARTYRDFRVLLEKEEGKIDAVIVATPDHTHAPAAAMAMRMKKHCYCEKPLTHTVKEARTLAELAKANDLVTQMGTQIHALDNYRRVVELVQSGAIGDIKEVHVWVPVDYSGGKFVAGEQPESLDWDLWLGPTAERPYSPNIHPFNWRRFWAFGSGGLGDFGCHYMDLVHWALDLRHPTRVEATGSPVDAVSCPSWVIAKYQYPARGKMPPVELTWYDGGKQPARLAELRGADGKPVNAKSGQLFVGSEGMILSNYTSHSLLPVEKFADFKRPPQTIPSSVGHHKEWLEAIQGRGATTCNFDYSGALTEAVLLGTVAYRSGVALDWDAESLTVKNSSEAQALIHKEYRKGWSL